MTDLRVAYVFAEGLTARGGIGRVGSYLARALADGRSGITLVEQKTRFSESGIARHATVMAALVQFAARCASRAIHVAHINVAPRGSTWRKMLFASTARALGIPLVLHLHGSGYDAYFGELSPDRQLKVRRLFQSANAVVALSDHWRDFVIDTLGVTPARVETIPNGVALATSAVMAHGDDPLRIVFLGVIGKRKGADLLLEALAALPPSLPAWRVVLGGNGGIDWARDLANSMGIDSARIDFPGWLDEAGVAAELSRADLFVLPSRAENQPVAILEAMACGLPVIASDVGAIPTQVIDGVTGRIIPSGDAAALSVALAELLADAASRQRMGAAGRERVREHYSIEGCAHRFADLYRRLAKAG